MTFAEKLIEVANNRPKLYKKGALDYSPQETVSGETISITDISPIEHNMGVKVSTKNIIKFPYYNASGTVSFGVTYTVNADGSVTVNGTTTSGTSMYYITEWTNKAWLNDWFEDGKTYVIGGSITTSKVQVILQCKRLSDNKDVYYYGNGKPFTIDKNTYKYCFLRIQVEPNTTVDNVTIYPIINKGTVVLPYAQRIEDISTVKLYKSGDGVEPIMYDVQADGTVEGVKSLYPSTSLYTDTSGAVIDCTYYQDGKKVKENLIDMILSLGGVINE